MSQWTQIPYPKIVAVAFIPAIMYFVSVAWFVEFRARKLGLAPMPAEDIPRVWDVLKGGWNLFIPVAVLVGLLVYGYTPTFAASAGIPAIVAASWLNRRTRMQPKDILDALSLGARNMVTTGIILLCSGIVVGVVLLVGMGLKFSMLISSISGGSLLLTIVLIALASLVLGMGLPVTASYIVLAVLAAPALTSLGVSLIAAHMLIFWYSQDANVTPPVCLAAYTAAGIGGSKPLETGVEAWKLAKGLYIIPALFVYTPLLLEGPALLVAETAITAVSGMCCFAACLEGFLLKPLSATARIALVAAALLLLFPSQVLHLIGITLFACVYIWLRATAKGVAPSRNGGYHTGRGE